MDSSERHLLRKVCSKLEVVQVNQQTVYYVRESTIQCFYEKLNLSLIIIKVIKIVYTCNEYELTVHTVKFVFETGRGLGVTPSSAVGP